MMTLWNREDGDGDGDGDEDRSNCPSTGQDKTGHDTRCKTDMTLRFTVVVVLVLGVAFSSPLSTSSMSAVSKPASGVPVNAAPQTLATFGAGCYWGTEKFFRSQFKNGGLLATAVGFMGGTSDHATYRQVCSGSTGHAEVLHLQYDPEKIKYDDLVTFFYRIHDATTKDRQGNDEGTQYRSVIFYHTEEQKKIAEQVTKAVKDKFKGEIVTEISPASKFIPAETDHQLYLEANPNGYCNHRIRW